MPPRRSPSPFRDHLVDTRRPLHSLPAIAPLVLAHAGLVWLFEPPVSARAANWVQWPLVRLGLTPGLASLALALLFVVAGVLLSFRDLKQRKTRFRPVLIPWIWFEGVTWGLILHLAWNGIGQGLPDGGGLGWGDNLTLALGAGVYEELVFRVAIFWIVLKILELMTKPERREAGVLSRRVASVLITSVVFALAHHLGPEPFELGPMLFRTVAALVLTTLFAWRGLGIAVCAHAAYDVFVVAL